MITEQPLIGIVVLNWKRLEYTQKCLRSLQCVNYKNTIVILVDNYSCDGSLETLREEFNEVIFIENKENLGFSGGVNPGIEKALELDAEFVMILNNDMIVDPEIFAESIPYMRRDKKVGAITGKILFDDNSNRIWQAGGNINIYKSQGVPRGLNELDVAQYDVIEETGWASGAMSIFPRKTIENIGLLPMEYFFGQEEWDYSVAILRNKLKIMYIPSFKGYHKAGGSYKANHPILNIYGGYLNKILFAKKYIHPSLFFIWKKALYLHLVYRWPRIARSYAENENQALILIDAAMMAYEDSATINYVKREQLEDASRRLGLVAGW
jgi:GT2 family glycosyltransferase